MQVAALASDSGTLLSFVRFSDCVDVTGGEFAGSHFDLDIGVHFQSEDICLMQPFGVHFDLCYHPLFA